MRQKASAGFAGARPMSRGILIVVSLLSGVVQADELQKQAERRNQERYATPGKEVQKLIKARRFGEAREVWLGVVPDEEKTGIDYFLLGNTFFESWPEKSLEFHRKAAELLPDEVDVRLEVAMALHRNRKFAEAIAPYETYLNSSAAKRRGPSTYAALLADCLVRSGDFKKACDTWESVPFRSYRIGIAHSCYAIHGPVGPHQRHFNLLTKARTKDLDAAVRVILLDTQWDSSWWDFEVNRDFLKADMEEFAALFPPDDPRMRLTSAIADHHAREKPDPNAFQAALARSNLLLGDKPSLPAHGLLVSHAVGILIEEKLATAEDLLKAHAESFRKEFDRPAHEMDLELATVWAALLTATDKNEELQEFDERIWRKTGSVRFAADYLRLLTTEGKDEDDPDVAAILKRYPTDRVVTSVALSLAAAQKRRLTEPLAAAISAEFESLTPNPLSGTRTADRLNALFRALRASLAE